MDSYVPDSPPVVRHVLPDGVKHKCMQLLGLAVRARQVALGNEAAYSAIRNGTAHLVLLAADAGSNTDKKYRDKCAFYHTALNDSFSRDELGHACGRSQMVIVAITDPGFAAKLQTYFGETSGGEAFGETSGV
jgi:ribosomal protein L7Ae-like RNA K-turn-binding protein